ncbi:ROK family protein [Pedobacter nutrimenti]|jgi:glucokinase|uniref:Glucokinase n=1 Tax=Pedobacter nutrimenti TaxID=1241337 RepID=A0A318UD22_9SPHI|nr:ROK family protein [Pedobacter nutrimenti]PYF72396.1 glucokinase [Pedobacter nutrimenti]
MKNSVALGIDIGGSHITAALVDLKTGSLLEGSRQRKYVRSDEAAEIILDHWCGVIREVFKSGTGLQKNIGIAMPGPFDYKAGISLIRDQDKFRTLYQVNIKTELARRLNIKEQEIRFINDAAGFLQGEVFGGAARNFSRVIGLTLGTGLGAAFCANGQATDAALWNAKFKEGIAEDYLSTRWFIKRYFELTGHTIAGVKELDLSTGRSPEIKKMFGEFAHHLGQFIHMVVQQQDADLIVLGGNISNAYPCFLPELEQEFQKYPIPAKVKIAELKEDAALIGAASLWGRLETAELK